MTADELKDVRKRLGISQSMLAYRLRLGPNGERTIRRWEQGDIPVTGPASVALEYMVRAVERRVKPRSRTKDESENHL